MKTIKTSINKVFIIKKSKFIVYLYQINSLEEVDSNLIKTRILEPNATHYCYAYLLDNNIKAFDDGEPTKTAGIPILNILQKYDLNHVLAIVVRYYGGIKLGASGLTKAYSNTTNNTVKDANIIELINGINCDITFNYDEQKNIDYLLKDLIINSKEYKANITYNITITNETLELLEKLNVLISNIKHTYIEKVNL